MRTQLVLVVLLFGATPAHADPHPAAAVAASPSIKTTLAHEDPKRGVEVNVLWPFFPGGIFEMRVILPMAGRSGLVVGAYSDFASRVVRDDTYGKVANLSAKLGWRQYVIGGAHVEASANLGWRHEEHRPPDDVTVDGFQTRLWTLAGYEHALSPRFYVNARAGVGFHVYRSDELAALEKRIVGGADLNLGVRF